MLLTLISGSVLISHWWTKRQALTEWQAQLEEKQRQAQHQYHLQEVISTAYLTQSPKIQAFFSDLLNTYAEKFAKIHSAEQSMNSLPLKFGGFYTDPQTGKGLGAMGRCFPSLVIYPYREEVIKIELNRLYLLNKFGLDRYFTSNPLVSDDYSYLDISFDKMIETCSHELAHYLQLVKWGRSSCESDLVLGRGNYSAELAQEHKKWTEEIYRMVRLEFAEWERRWREI